MGNNNSSDEMNYHMRVPAVMSILGSCLILLSYAVFPRIRAMQYQQLVFYVAVNDLFASVGVSIGVVSNDSFACWFQAFTTNYNFLSSICWTTVIAYQLVAIVKYQEIAKPQWQRIHAFCWGFPLVVTMIPLTTNTYGNMDDDPGWCFIGSRPGSPVWGVPVWELLSFYLWVWVAILIISAMYISLLLHIRRYKPSSPLTKPIANSIKSLSFYPLILMVCWGFTSVEDMYDGFTGSYHYYGGQTVDSFATILPALQGLFHAIIFIGRNDLVYKEWRNFLRGKFLSFHSQSAAAARSSLTNNDIAQQAKDSHSTGNNSPYDGRGRSAAPSTNVYSLYEHSMDATGPGGFQLSHDDDDDNTVSSSFQRHTSFVASLFGLTGSESSGGAGTHDTSAHSGTGTGTGGKCVTGGGGGGGAVGMRDSSLSTGPGLSIRQSSTTTGGGGDFALGRSLSSTTNTIHSNTFPFQAHCSSPVTSGGSISSMIQAASSLPAISTRQSGSSNATAINTTNLSSPLISRDSL